MENTEMKAVLDQIKNGVTGFDQKFDSLTKRLDEMEVRQNGSRPGGAQEANAIEEAFKGSEDFQAFLGGRRKSAIVVLKDFAPNLKTAITSSAVGSGTAGVLMPEKVGGIVPLAQRRNFMRDVLVTQTTSNNAVYFIKENTFTNAASPQVEASAKGESGITFTTDTAPVRTIAHWLPCSKQVADDFTELMGFIRRKLLYGYLLVEDTQILYGDGTGNNLSGLTVEATAFSTSLLPASSGWQKADILRRAIQQVERGDEAATGWFVLNPDDWCDIELLKDSQGNYICGDPRSMMAPTLWGKPCAVTTAMTSGKFLAGSGEAADLRLRQDVTFEISNSHEDYFAKNMLACRLEARVALPIYRPGALIYGNMTKSPA